MTEPIVKNIAEAADRTVRVVDGCHFAPISTVEKHFDISNRQARLVLKYLRIPAVAIGKTLWYNMYALDKVFYYVSRAGGVGFSGPGTLERQRGHNLYMPRLTDEDLLIVNSLDFTLEWLAMSYYRHDGRPKKIKQIVRLAKEGLKGLSDL